MYFNFGIEIIIALSVISFLCLLFFFYLRKLYHMKIEKETDLANKKYGTFLVIIGLIVVFSSLIVHLYIQIDLARSSGFFKFLSEITASPILFFTIVFFMIGITILFMGISSIRFRRETLDKSA